MRALVTAIVVVHDSAAVLPRCLASLAAEGVPAVVVDNASTDETVGVARAAGATIVRNARNEGFGRAMTIGVREAATPLCLLVNPDLTFDPGAVAELLAAAGRYPDAALLAPRLIEPDGRVFFQPRSLLAGFLPNPKGVLRQPDGDCCVPFLSGACLLVRRDAFLAVGGFDPAIFLFYEDDDLCRRLGDAGRALVHVHGAVARHARGTSAAPKPGRHFRARWHGAWSRVYVSRKWGLGSGSAATIAISALKLLPSLLLFRRQRIERYAGTLLGTLAALRGRSALAREGLE